jgi:hypothetical protein
MTNPAIDVRAADVNSYLASKGWEREDDRHGASVWRLGTMARLLIPEGHEYEDDDELFRESIRRIATYEARPVADLLLDIAEPNVDTQFFRAYPETPSGTITLPSGVKLVNSIHELMRSAAATSERGAQLLIGRRSRLVDTFLHRVLLGTAAPGSYVLTARVPAGPIGQQTLDAEEEFSGRSVVTQLHSALTAARAAARLVLEDEGLAARSSHLVAFSDSIGQGVSANLCKALGDLGGEQRERPFDIGFSWARGVPGQAPSAPVKFTGAMARILYRAGEDLEALAKSGRAQITGRVEELRQRPGEEPRAKIVGELRTQGNTLPDRHLLWVVLSPEQNDQAIEAYREGWALEIEGRLTNNRRALELIVQNFRVLR